MEALLLENNSNNLMEPKWGKMLAFSLFIHLAAFSIILFVPEQIPTRRIKGTVYEVNLVEMPRGKRVTAKGSSKEKRSKSVHRPKKAAPAKRIARTKQKEKPIVVAKRTVKTRRVKAKKAEVSTSKLIDEALSKIEKRVQEEEKNREEEEHIEQVISDLDTQVKDGEGQGVQGAQGAQGGQLGFSDTGIHFSIYQMEVANKIKSNWTYPVAQLSTRDREKFEAVVVVRVKSDGTILKSWVTKRSSDVIFDQSVLKAVERSDPLPPFPEGYRKTHDEIEFTFNLKDLEKY